MIGHAAPHNFPASNTYRKHPELFFHDLMCPITHDRTHDRVRSSLPQLPAPRQRMSSVTGRRPYVSGHFHCAASGHGPDRARARQLHYKSLDAQQVSPITSGLESSVDQKLLLLISNFATLDQMCQPPSVSPCARVLAYFHKHFQGCLHSLESKCTCNELEHLLTL
jgi:hypothetical protein